ncbi:MAG: hypothetical protein JST10_00795 [Bacteroidetes bacterium]|nr:hypothetical protein [Bacteroidota bacterium]MBS1631087.1 hypothetical protein [Bacteroidota bacterium]
MKKFEMLGRKLSKEEQKNIIGGFIDPGGGGSCCAHYSEAPGNEIWCCGLSKKDAMDKAASWPGGGNWCCDSCQGHPSDGCA